MRKKHRPVSNINVTPMVDVMLVLLIVFMVTAPLLTVGVPVNLPKVEANSLDAQKEPLEISINENNEIYLGEELGSWCSEHIWFSKNCSCNEKTKLSVYYFTI